MKLETPVVGVICVACLARSTLAQSTFANFALSWSEVDASTHLPISNSNGILEPGEAAKLSFSVAFSPIGTVVQVPAGTATVSGFARTGFILEAGLIGAWSDQQVPSGFLTYPLLPLGQNILQDVWQPNPALGSSPISTNPIPSLWSAVLAPAMYMPSFATFRLSVRIDDYPTLFVRTGTDPQGNPLFGTVEPLSDWGADLTIPIAPAPSIPSAVVLASVFAARRRRPGQTSC